MRKKYVAPPIAEAVCEFRLTSDTPWDLAVPGLFYEKVKDTFPRRKQRTVQEIEFVQGSDGLQQHPRTNERIMLLTEDQKMVVQIGPRLLVINALKPYPTWEGFKPRIEMAWKSLQHVVEVKGIQRMGVRYVHSLALPAQNIKLSEYFEFHPLVARDLRGQMASFLMVTEFSFADGRDRCRVQLVAPPPDSREKRISVLDIYHFLFQPCAVEIANALAWIETAHVVCGQHHVQRTMLPLDLRWPTLPVGIFPLRLTHRSHGNSANRSFARRKMA